MRKNQTPERESPDAEKEFRVAVELDPKNGKAHHWYATSLQCLGRHDEAPTEIDLARKLARTRVRS
jgi:Flp pilus assembly protein TadD